MFCPFNMSTSYLASPPLFVCPSLACLSTSSRLSFNGADLGLMKLSGGINAANSRVSARLRKVSAVTSEVKCFISVSATVIVCDGSVTVDTTRHRSVSGLWSSDLLAVMLTESLLSGVNL